MEYQKEALEGMTSQLPGARRSFDTSHYGSSKADKDGIVHRIIVPTTQSEKQAMTAIVTAELNVFIEQALKQGNVLSVGGVSDGYHTFNELYEFRAVLTSALFKMVYRTSYRNWSTGKAGEVIPFNNPVWKSKLHSDGTMFDNYFIVGLYNVPGQMITFHYPIESWDLFDYANVLEKAPEWDGHTSKDVLDRIKNL